MSIYDSTNDEFFLKKLKEFESLLWYVAKRFEIPGVLSKEDLYQEGLITLDFALEQNWEYHPDTPEFNRMFKSRLYHAMSAQLRFHKQRCRDWRNELRDSVTSYEDSEGSLLDNLQQSTFRSPDYRLENDSVKMFFVALESRIEDAASNGSIWGGSADDALTIFRMISDPNFEVPQSVVDMYERFPSRLTNTILSEVLGWNVMRVRRAVSKLRKHAKELSIDYGIVVP